MKGRHFGLRDFRPGIVKLAVELRIRSLVRRLQKLQPTMAQYKVLLLGEVDWLAKDNVQRKATALLILGPQIIYEKLAKKTEPLAIDRIDWAIEQLEEHVSPTKAHFKEFLDRALDYLASDERLEELRKVKLP